MRLPSHTADSEQLFFEINQTCDENVSDATMVGADDYLNPQDMQRWKHCQQSVVIDHLCRLVHQLLVMYLMYISLSLISMVSCDMRHEVEH